MDSDTLNLPRGLTQAFGVKPYICNCCFRGGLDRPVLERKPGAHSKVCPSFLDIQQPSKCYCLSRNSLTY